MKTWSMVYGGVLTLTVLLVPFAAAAEDDALDGRQSAETTVSAEELDAFAPAYLEVRVLTAQLEGRVNRILSQSTLDSRRFREVHRVIGSSESPEDVDAVSDDEADTYRELVERLEQVREETQMRMHRAIDSEGLSVERFGEIVAALPRDADLADALRARLDDIIARRTGHATED